MANHDYALVKPELHHEFIGLWIPDPERLPSLGPCADDNALHASASALNRLDPLSKFSWDHCLPRKISLAIKEQVQEESGIAQAFAAEQGGCSQASEIFHRELADSEFEGWVHESGPRN